MNWIDKKSEIEPPKHRVLLVYCPDWCNSEYSIVKWNGREFKCEIHDNEISNYVEKWCMFLEAD